MRRAVFPVSSNTSLVNADVRSGINLASKLVFSTNVEQLLQTSHISSDLQSGFAFRIS